MDSWAVERTPPPQGKGPDGPHPGAPVTPIPWTDPLTELKERKRKRREIVSIFLILLAFTGLTLLELELGEGRSGLPFNDNILFFAIINLNIVLVLLLIFLIVRNLVKLIFERRRRVLGAKLRTKLVAAFVFLSLMPTAILFYVAWSFISRSVEMWVHVQVERALEGALSVSRNYYKGRAEDTLYFTKQIAQSLEREGLLEPGREKGLKEFLRLEQIAFRLSGVLLIGPGPEEIVSWFPAEGEARAYPPGAAVLEKVWDGEEVARIRSVARGEVMEAIVPVRDPRAGRKGRVALVVQSVIPVSLVDRMAEISESLERHQQMMMFKVPLKSTIFMALILVTLLIVFSASWFGFYLAKGITTPIQHLAGGIREVAAGNLSHRIESGSEDEMGILVDAYNAMVDDLNRKDVEVQEAQRRLFQSNEELEARRRYMEILLRNVGAGVLSLDREGRVRTANRFMEDLFSIRASAFVGEPYAALFRTEAMKPIRDLIEEVNQREFRSTERVLRVTLQHEPRTLLVRSSVLEDETGGWMGLVMVFEDHSELIRAQRAAAWREVARRIAHEIKNPLTPIQLSAQRLQKRYRERFEDKDARVFEEATSTIIRQVDEMKNIVNEFSLFARMPAANPVSADLNDLVHEVLALYRQAHREVAFRLDVDAEAPPLLLDPDQMRRVLNNLLDNAVDSTSEAGAIEVATRYELGRKRVVLEVADNGCGIPTDMRERIFEPYATTKKGGTGLGLVIVKTIVADHNGYIRVRDNEPKGTRFSVEFPVPNV